MSNNKKADDLRAAIARVRRLAVDVCTGDIAKVLQCVYGAQSDETSDDLFTVCDAAAERAAEPGVPACRGYAALGTGQYVINHSAAGEPAELVISLATEEDKRGRQIGESRDNPPDSPPIQADEMIIRIAFTSERGLFALEDQLAWVRRVHFADDARPPLTAPVASEPLNPPTAWDLQHRGASTEPRNGTSASEPQAVRNVDDLRDAGADAEQAAIDSLAEPQFDFARAIHYPEHWDMAAYPTLESAIWEALSCAGCSECKPASGPQAEPQEGDLLHTMIEWARTEEGRKQLADSYRPHLWACAKRVADPQNEAATCRHWCGDIEHCQPIASAPAQVEPQPEAIPIAPVEVVRQALKELLESISECRMDQVTARFAKASVMARAVVDRYKDAT